MQITLARMSRIVVPKAIRDRFALKPGEELEITLEADGIRLRPAVSTSPLAEEGGLLVCSSEFPPSAWDVERFYTLNLRHFRSLAPGDSIIASP